MFKSCFQNVTLEGKDMQKPGKGTATEGCGSQRAGRVADKLEAWAPPEREKIHNF